MQSSNHTIFAVDDEPAVLALYRNILGGSSSERLGFFDTLDKTPAKAQYDLHTFETGEAYLDALKAAYKAHGRVALSLIDMRLPGKHGLEIAKEARSIDPDMRIIIVTAYSDYSVEELLGQFEQDVYYMHKPFRQDELIALVTTNLKHWNAKADSVDIKHELAVDATQDGLWDWNPKTNEVYFSQRWKEMLGFNDDELSNQLEEWSNRVHPDDMEQVMRDVQAHLSGETDHYINEHRLRCKDGSYKWILDRGKALFDEQGKPYRMVGFHTDISERKRLEEQLKSMSHILSEELESSLSNESKLRHTNRELEQKLNEEIRKRREQENILLHQTRQAAMGEMVSMIAHQWRQPITAIGLGVDNILMDMALGSVDMGELKNDLYSIRDQVDYLSQTIDDFRDFFLPNKSKEEIRVSDCLDAALNIIDKSLQHHGIQVVKEYGDPYPLSLYKNEIIQVFLNILKNADDVLMERHVADATLWLRTIEHDDAVEVRIGDNAGGIPAEIINRIYEPYFTTKNEYNGTGLGLYMSKTIVEEHCCGLLRAENVDRGARFTIVLPKVCHDPRIDG